MNDIWCGKSSNLPGTSLQNSAWKTDLCIPKDWTKPPQKQLTFLISHYLGPDSVDESFAKHIAVLHAFQKCDESVDTLAFYLHQKFDNKNTDGPWFNHKARSTLLQ